MSRFGPEPLAFFESGDLAIHIAGRGVDTLGIDFVEQAIAQAKAKKAALSPDVAGRRFSREKGWRALTIRAGEFLSRIAPVPAIVTCFEYAGKSGG